MSDLQEYISECTDYFAGQAAEFRAEADCPVIFQDPYMEISAQTQSPYSEASRAIAAHGMLYISAIEEFLQAQDITELAYVGQGATALAFEVGFNKLVSDRYILRIGPKISRYDKNAESFRRYNRPWCPLVLQPQTEIAFAITQSYETKRTRLGLELLPLAGVVPENRPWGFGYFLNQHVLAGTPYMVDANKDLGVLPDGTPVYLDPDSLNFKTAELAKANIKDQHQNDWQQNMMAIIDANCRKLNLPQSLSWVAQKPDGYFATKQSQIYGNLTPSRPNRSLIRLKKTVFEF